MDALTKQLVATLDPASLLLFRSLFILLLFTLLLTNGVLIAYQARNKFASVVALGMVGILLYNILVNIWMTVGLAPVTGLPLPLISYGGSSLITTLFEIGLLANVSIRRHDY